MSIRQIILSKGKSVIIKRMSQDAGNAYTSTYNQIGTEKMYIEPQSAGDAVISDGLVGQIFLGFSTEDADIKSGDQVIDGETIYVIDGIEVFDSIGLNKHKEATMRKMSN